MTFENYYLAFYQAILDNDLIKLVRISKLTNEEHLNYPKEHPHLDANEIFKDNHPMDFINSLLRTPNYEALYLKYNDAREKTHLELLEHPLIDYCSNNKSSIIDNLLSVTYSKVITKEEVITKLTPLINQSPIINDVLSTISTSTIIDSSRPFSIALIDEEMESYDPTIGSTTRGYNKDITNRIVVTNENAKLNLESMIHEFAHKTMYKVFGKSTPYNNESSKDKYHNAIKNTLLNIQTFIKQDFGLDIKFKDQNDTWQMGKTLKTMLFPQYLEGDGIQEFISSLKEYNLNINDYFSWLNGSSPLGVALSHLKFELADSLVAAGATINPITVHIAAEINNTDLFNWFLENKAEFDINYQDCEGMTALDYASDPQIIKTLISAKAIAYPPNFEPICDIDPECKDPEENSTIITEQLSALETLLNLYNPNQYDKNNEDEEFIVRLPEIIVAGLYQGKIAKALEPSAQYWQENISKAAALYQEQHKYVEDYFALYRTEQLVISSSLATCEAE